MCGFNPPLELRIFHLNDNKANDSESGCGLFGGFWVGHADARHAVAGVSGP
ncbi:hypothetical protein DPMN_140751 [Dreissena polymorpha]|uniref:Uncharacterized protein n=1 Tax=Dreissena polymorpha TaxID=45954 RepID=A0A9D4G8P9_DREPO|nr:hypothetical protein DPMN_140751 [Dreissena polymorpha]